MTKEDKQKLIADIKDIIDTAEKFKNSYFWQPPSSAGERRRYEDFYTKSPIKWIEGDDVYTAKFDVTCSCKNVYTKGYYTKNGVKTTLLAIKNSYKRLGGKL